MWYSVLGVRRKGLPVRTEAQGTGYLAASSSSRLLRFVQAYFPAYGTIALFVVFGKNERSDLSAAEARATAKALKAFEIELRRAFEQRT